MNNAGPGVHVMAENGIFMLFGFSEWLRPWIYVVSQGPQGQEKLEEERFHDANFEASSANAEAPFTKNDGARFFQFSATVFPCSAKRK